MLRKKKYKSGRHTDCMYFLNFLSFMRNLRNTGIITGYRNTGIVPFLEMETLKHRLGTGDRANSQRSLILMLLLFFFFNSSTIKICKRLYKAVGFGLFDNRNAT